MGSCQILMASSYAPIIGLEDHEAEGLMLEINFKPKTVTNLVWTHLAVEELKEKKGPKILRFFFFIMIWK